jgi:hypothetical protein
MGEQKNERAKKRESKKTGEQKRTSGQFQMRPRIGRVDSTVAWTVGRTADPNSRVPHMSPAHTIANLCLQATEAPTFYACFIHSASALPT